MSTSSASAADFCTELMNAINAFSGFYAVASVNADGTPNPDLYLCLPK